MKSEDRGSGPGPDGRAAPEPDAGEPQNGDSSFWTLLIWLVVVLGVISICFLIFVAFFSESGPAYMFERFLEYLGFRFGS